MPLLTDLLNALNDPQATAPANPSPTISQITSDSRQVRAGALFVALRGEKSDGAKFVPQARIDGAVAVLCDKDAELGDTGNMAVIRVENPRLALARIASAFYPRQPSHIVAVTGTDGKTSTADFFRQLMHGLDKPSASIGTLGVLSGAGESLFPGSHTTPDPVALHKLLTDLAQRGTDYVCMEASSHGLHQHRMDGVTLQGAAFTNIARDHLDYHKTDDNYFAAKARLFSDLLGEGKTAVVNQDDKRFPEIKAMCARRGLKLVGFGRSGAELGIRHIEPMPHGQRVQLELYGRGHELEVSLVGGFQIMNILAAIGLAEAVGADIEEVFSLATHLRGVPGRLEQVATLKNGAAVFVDYAHTPMALASILHTLRPHTHGKLHVVFGCGGDRDTGKRPEMGRVASDFADTAIVTDDNPRSEEPAAIRAAILAAAPHAKEVADRREAIYVAIKALGAGDVLVIAGKGHEKTQIVGDKTLPFDDAKIAQEAVRDLSL